MCNGGSGQQGSIEMDDKSFAVLTSLKKQFSEKNETLKFTGQRKLESETNIRVKHKAKTLSEDAPVSKVLPKQAHEKSVAKAKKKKRKNTNAGLKKEIKAKLKPVEAITQPPPDLICNLKLTDKSQGRPTKPAISVSANDDFKPKFDAKHSF